MNAHAHFLHAACAFEISSVERRKKAAAGLFFQPMRSGAWARQSKPWAERVDRHWRGGVSLSNTKKLFWFETWLQTRASKICVTPCQSFYNQERNKFNESFNINHSHLIPLQNISENVITFIQMFFFTSFFSDLSITFLIAVVSHNLCQKLNKSDTGRHGTLKRKHKLNKLPL